MNKEPDWKQALIDIVTSDEYMTWDYDRYGGQIALDGNFGYGSQSLKDCMGRLIAESVIPSKKDS